jgi:hypothetical protein
MRIEQQSNDKSTIVNHQSSIQWGMALGPRPSFDTDSLHLFNLYDNNKKLWGYLQ